MFRIYLMDGSHIDAAQMIAQEDNILASATLEARFQIIPADQIKDVAYLPGNPPFTGHHIEGTPRVV